VDRSLAAAKRGYRVSVAFAAAASLPTSPFLKEAKVYYLGTIVLTQLQEIRSHMQRGSSFCQSHRRGNGDSRL
jgi:hypothetical protein